MLTFIGIAAGILAIAVAVILALATGRPDAFHIQRTATIEAAPERIFPLINDLRENSRWSPFENDPAMTRVHSGSAAGKGAVFEWNGNRQVGRGRIAITDSVPPSKVVMALDMFTPFEAHNVVEFTLAPHDGKTDVTWSMRGPQPFMAKLMSTVMDCDKMVGSQFEEGLGKLKAIAESRTGT